MRVPVLSAAEAADWDAAARTTHGIPSRVLMEAAGRAAAQVIATAAPADGNAPAHTALIACGPGNNGGDGWVIARALHAAGWRVWATDHERERSTDCEANRTLALAAGVMRLGPEAPWPQVGLVVDALLGTGASGAPRGDLGTLAQRIAEGGAPVAAVDGPTGLDLSTGTAHGPVRARLTVTFGGARRGHLLQRDWCGDVVVVDIGFPPADAALPLLSSDAWVAAHLPPLASTMHKGERGKVLIVGGAEGMAGAAIHAARGALAAGAGLVKLAVPEASISPVQANLPDALTTPWDAVEEALGWADAVVLGPGLGRQRASVALAERVVELAQVPLVLDADALHVAGIAGQGTAPRVLTPHEGEFTAQFPDASLEDRFAAPGLALPSCPPAVSAVLLKGVPTVIARPDGPPHVVARGNVGLATGGSGDVLAGVIGVLLARGMAPGDAAALGAHVCGRAAELAADTTTARALRPDDVTAALPDVWRALAAPARPVPPVLDVLPAPAVV